MITTRKSSGNMTVLMSLTFGLLIAACVVGLIVNSLMFQRSRNQHDADALAVSLADKLNVGNRVGQINELEAQSRELVYVSRQMSERCASEEPLLAPLAGQLLEQSRVDHELVAAERRNLAMSMVEDVQYMARTYNAQATNDLNLPWLTAKAARINRIDLGAIANVQSSVRSPRLFADLADFDIASGYVDKRSRLFRAELNAKLPEDGDLRFDFASLPACISGTASPARNTNDDVFVLYKRVVETALPVEATMQKLPTAVQVTCSSDVSVNTRESAHSDLQLRSTAITFGAGADEH
jgi:hypothetical protein